MKLFECIKTCVWEGIRYEMNNLINFPEGHEPSVPEKDKNGTPNYNKKLPHPHLREIKEEKPVEPKKPKKKEIKKPEKKEQ